VGCLSLTRPALRVLLVQNRQVSLEWLPNAAFALVAVSLETPLSQPDLDLLRSLDEYEYTAEIM
jgi:hypothetical protein